MGHLPILSLLSLLLLILSAQPQAQAQTATSPAQAGFNCSSSSRSTCSALAGYISPNTTTLARIQSLFQVPSLLSLLGVNGLPPNTPPTHTVKSGQTVRIPFPCKCSKGYGFSDHVPQYKIVDGDGLYNIATEVFAGLMTYPQIWFANTDTVKDPGLIYAGKNLSIPLPCSCDDVDGQEVVHYAHVVAPKSTVAAIAAEFGTTAQTLMRLNGITDPKMLMADQVLDVPLKACSSSVNSNSPDYPLLLANGSYIYTAYNCMKCSCDSTNNFTLRCEASGLNSTKWSTCPTTQCSANNLALGKSTSSGCSGLTCAYAGYTNRSILVTTVPNTCAGAATPGKNEGWKIQQSGWSLGLILLSIQLFLLTM